MKPFGIATPKMFYAKNKQCNPKEQKYAQQYATVPKQTWSVVTPLSPKTHLAKTGLSGPPERGLKGPPEKGS